jgi:activator of HSP90 ATPase
MSVVLDSTSLITQNGYAVYSAGPPVTGDFTVANVDAMVDDCINTVNLFASQDMAAMSGTPKTVTVTREQSIVVKMLLTLVLRENKKTQLSNSSSTGNASGTAKSINVGPIGMSQSNSVSTSISATAAINNPANSVYVGLFEKACDLLKGKSTQTTSMMPIYIGNAPMP